MTMDEFIALMLGLFAGVGLASPISHSIGYAKGLKRRLENLRDDIARHHEDMGL